MIVLAILEILTMIHSAIVGLSDKFTLKEFILAAGPASVCGIF